MKFTKIVIGGYILGLAVADKGIEITEQEYRELTDIFHAMPVREGYAYRLREDLTWEEYPAEPEPVDEISNEEALEILLGGGDA
jgi:hypothetical protein